MNSVATYTALITNNTSLLYARNVVLEKNTISSYQRLHCSDAVLCGSHNSSLELWVIRSVRYAYR
jgi:hypothetical protein